jgi:hypothetical protein
MHQHFVAVVIDVDYRLAPAKLRVDMFELDGVEALALSRSKPSEIFEHQSSLLPCSIRAQGNPTASQRTRPTSRPLEQDPKRRLLETLNRRPRQQIVGRQEQNRQH